MIDIGANLLSEQFAEDREAVLARAWQAGVRHVIVTGTDLDGSRAAAGYAAAHGDGRLSATAGIHPHHAGQVPGGWQSVVRALAALPQVVAIGETGLDFNRNFSTPEAQRRVFRDHLALAAELEMPLFVHDREAGVSVAECLREVLGDARQVVVHCFTGSREDLDRYLALGCHIGITGWVCDRRRGEELRSLVPHIPLQRLMIETDAPYLKPHNAPQRGRRNEPALLPWVARQLAELYRIDEDELVEITSRNARAFFALDDPAATAAPARRRDGPAPAGP